VRGSWGQVLPFQSPALREYRGALPWTRGCSSCPGPPAGSGSAAWPLSEPCAPLEHNDRGKGGAQRELVVCRYSVLGSELDVQCPANALGCGVLWALTEPCSVLECGVKESVNLALPRQHSPAQPESHSQSQSQSQSRSQSKPPVTASSQSQAEPQTQPRSSASHSHSQSHRSGLKAECSRCSGSPL